MIASMASASAAVAERMARPSGKRDIRRVFLLHADGVIARVDMVGFAGDAASEIAQQIERRAADVVDRDVAAQRGVMFIPLEDQAEVADSARDKRLDWSARKHCVWGKSVSVCEDLGGCSILKKKKKR